MTQDALFATPAEVERDRVRAQWDAALAPFVEGDGWRCPACGTRETVDFRMVWFHGVDPDRRQCMAIMRHAAEAWAAARRGDTRGWTFSTGWLRRYGAWRAARRDLIGAVAESLT